MIMPLPRPADFPEPPPLLDGSPVLQALALAFYLLVAAIFAVMLFEAWRDCVRDQ